MKWRMRNVSCIRVGSLGYRGKSGARNKRVIKQIRRRVFYSNCWLANLSYFNRYPTISMPTYLCEWKKDTEMKLMRICYTCFRLCSIKKRKIKEKIQQKIKEKRKRVWENTLNRYKPSDRRTHKEMKIEKCTSAKVDSFWMEYIYW